MNDLSEWLKSRGRRAVYPQMGGVGLKLTPYRMFQVYEDPEKQLEISLRIEETFPTDFTYPVDFGYVFLHDLGLDMLKPDHDFPSVLENPAKTAEQIEHFRRAWEQGLDLCGEKGGKALLPAYLESIEKIASRIPKPEMVAVPGPFTLAGELVGITDLAKFTLKKPQLVEAALELTEAILCGFITEAVDRGASLIQISEPTAVILSPAMFRKWITPGLRRMFGHINGQAWSALHICGNVDAYLDEMISAGPMVLSLDQIMDMKAAAERTPGNIILAGNTDPVGIMLQGTPEQVRSAVETLLNEMAPYDNYMPSFGCDCPVDTPVENMQAFTEAVYGWKKGDGGQQR